MLEKQIELEKKMTDDSVNSYRNELNKALQKENFSNTQVATTILSRILDNYTKAIEEYIHQFEQGLAVRYSQAANLIRKLDIDSVAMIAAKVLINKCNTVATIQSVYKAIGQALEDEWKMRMFKKENAFYYDSIQKDLNKRGAKANRKKNITMGVFDKRLGFHLDKWTMTEKIKTGWVLTYLFIDSTELIYIWEHTVKGKTIRHLVATDLLLKWMEQLNTKLEVLNPFFLPMVCPPKEWTGMLEGGYISPYLKKNKFIKNNDRDYLKLLESAKMPKVYSAVNHLQQTAWQINTKVLDVVKALWDIGKAVAELPDREDEPLIPYPYPDKDTKTDSYTDEEKEVIRKWKRDTYDIHKRNVQKRSVRILVSQIMRIAEQFKGYDKIWFPYQMDFRGRVYPIPVLLQPQGSDLAKGLLRFANGKRVDKSSIRWLQIHGANVYGYDKASYNDRVQWVLQHEDDIKSYVANPLENRGWTDADKPFQFLAWCYEYNDYLDNPDDFETHIPVQLDGTCNGLQHYSALLRDPVGGKAVNLVNTEKPSDIYAKVAEKLEEKLNDIKDNKGNYSNTDYLYSVHWLSLGINRKLTKRPVMVLPYGGTLLSCRQYISEYLNDNYSNYFLLEHFGIGECPADAVFKAAAWLSKYLWSSIQETLVAATVGMDYLRKLTRVVNKYKQPMEWFTPVGLLIKQSYPERKKKQIQTELYGSVHKVVCNLDYEGLDTQRQVNGICPNFIHSLDAACLMVYLNKCKAAGIDSVMSVHDCYGTLAPDCDKSARFLREAFVEIYRQPILENFTEDVTQNLPEGVELPELPQKGTLDIEGVLESEYFFN